jgi:hypothetical protein
MANRSCGVIVRALSRLQPMKPLINPTSDLDIEALRGS